MTPGAILSAHEPLANLLAEIGKPLEALAEYEASLEAPPAQLDSYAGAIPAADAAGHHPQAVGLRDRIAAMCGGTLPDRAALAAARLGDG